MATSVGDAQVKANQAAAAKLGISIPGVGGGDSSAPNIALSSTKTSANGQVGATQKTYYSGGSSVSKSVYDQATIGSSALAPSQGITVPTPAPASTTGSNAMTLLAGLGAGTDASQTTSTTAAPLGTPTDLQARLESIVKPPKVADIYAQARQDTGVEQKQQQVNTYQNQLNAIVAKSQADKLSLTGQGRGIPEVIIGGQQAQIDKEAAIQSLPIAAQLAAAQGDLKLAEDHLNTLFTLRSQDATNEYNFKTKLVDTVFNYADKQQQIALDAKKTQDAQNFQLMTNNLNYAQSLATAALNNGQSSTAAALMRLDPNDPNYSANIASVAKNITPKSTSTKTATAKGGLSNNTFVNRVLSAQGLSYEDAVAQIPSGRVGVIDNITGAIGSISPDEFDSSKYTKL